MPISFQCENSKPNQTCTGTMLWRLFVTSKQLKIANSIHISCNVFESYYWPADMMRKIADDVRLWRLWWSAGSLCIWFSAFISPLGFLFHKPCPCPVTREFPDKPTLMICIYCNLRYLLVIQCTSVEQNGDCSNKE